MANTSVPSLSGSPSLSDSGEVLPSAAPNLTGDSVAPVPGPAIDGAPSNPIEPQPDATAPRDQAMPSGLSDMGDPLPQDTAAPETAPTIETQQGSFQPTASEGQLPVPDAPAEPSDSAWPTPEEVTAAKAQRPELSSLSDDDAAAVLYATRVTPQEIAQASATVDQPKPYSLWNDISSMPGALWRGALKGGVLEPYDFANEVVLGNEANPSAWRKDFENYYKSMPQGSRIVGAFAQFGASYIGLGKIARMAGLLRGATTAAGAIGQAAARGAVTDALAFDGKETRLSNLLREHAGFNDAVTAYLASSPDDTEAEGRFKNMLEGLGIGVTLDVGLRVVKSLRAAQRGNLPAADAELKAAEEAFAKINQGKGLSPSVSRAMEPEVAARPPGQQAVAAISGQTPPARVDIQAVDPSGPFRGPQPSRVPNPSVTPEGPAQGFGEVRQGQMSVERGLARTGLAEPPRRPELPALTREAAPDAGPLSFRDAARNAASEDRALLRTGLLPPDQAPIPGAGTPEQAFQGINRNVRSVEAARQRGGLAADESVRNALARYERIPAQKLPKPRVSVQADATPHPVEFKPVPAPPNHAADTDGMLAKRQIETLWSYITGRSGATEQQAIASVERALDRFNRLNTPATISDMGSKITVKPAIIDTPSTPTGPSAADASLASRLKPANDILPMGENRPVPANLQDKGVDWNYVPGATRVDNEVVRRNEDWFLREGTGTVVDRIRALGYDVRLFRSRQGSMIDQSDAFAHESSKSVGLNREQILKQAQRFGIDPKEMTRRALEHEEVHVLRVTKAISNSEWRVLLEAAQSLRIVDDAFSRADFFDKHAGKTISDALRETDYEGWYREQGWSEARIKEAMDQETVAWMIGNRLGGELPNTPEFRKAVELVGQIRDGSIAGRTKGIQSGPTAEQVAGARTGRRGYHPPEWVPRPINEDTPLLAMRSKPHPGTVNLVKADKDLVDGVADDIIKIARHPELDTLGTAVPAPSRFDSLTHEGHIRAVIEATERRLLKEMPEAFANRGAVSYLESFKLAQSWGRQLGQEPGEIINRITRESDRMENVHARLFAMRQYTTGLADELHTLARQLDPENLQPEFGAYGSREAAEQALRDKTAHYIMVQDMVGGMTSEVGRALNAMRRSRVPNQQIDFASTAADGPLDKLIERIKTAGSDPEAMGRALSPTRYEALRDFVQAAWIRSILSGWETHAVNVTSSFTATALHPLYKIVGGYGLGDQSMIREGMRQYSYMVSEASTVLGYARDSFKAGRPMLDPKLDRFGQFPTDAMDPKRAFGVDAEAYKQGLSASTIAESAVGHALKIYGAALDVVSTRTLSAQDELFKRAAYHAEALAAAHTDGLSLGLKGAELDAYARKRFEQTFIDDPTLGRIPNPDDPLAQRALSVAKTSTFMNTVPHDSFLGLIKQATARYPMLRFAVPFPSIVHNLMHYTKELTPGLAHMSKSYQEAIKAGGHEAAVATGKLYMGYALWMLAIPAALAKLTRGSGPLTSDGRPDWSTRQMLEQRGMHHGGLDIPGTDVSLNVKRMDPFGIIFNVPAIVAERIDDFDDQHMGQWAMVFAMSVADSLLSRHIMSGVSQLIEAGTDMSGDKAGRYVANIGASLVFPNVINQTNNYLGDPMIREANTWFDMALKRLPVASEGLAARRTPWGEPMVKQGGVITSHKDSDELLNEYARLVETGNKGVPEPLPRTKQIPGEKGSLDLVEFRLSNGKRLYDEYGDRMQNPAPGSLPSLRSRLESFIKSDDYQNRLIDGPGDMPGTKLFAVRRIIQQYRNAAWHTILRDHPEVVDRVYHQRRTIGQEVEAQRRAVQRDAYGLDE